VNKFKKVIVNTVFTGVLALILYGCHGQSKSDKIDALISTYAEYGKFNGAVLVAEGGEIIYKKGWGLANVEEKIPNKPDTKFRLGSVTKQFTATLIVQLVSENKLKLDVPISTYLPDYPKKTGDIITIHHLLTHTSGIPDFTSFSNYGAIQDSSFTPAELVKLFADSMLEFTPGEKFQYSNSGYILLGYIIEKVTGKVYEEVLQSKILTPLKMTHTGVDHNSTGIKNKASGYNRVGNTFQNARYIDMSVPYAAGAIYSTVEDMYQWDQALYTEKLLPKKYLDLMFESYIAAFGSGYYGYGWEISKMPVGSTSDQIQTINHSGVINGFNSMITRIPSNKSLIVLLNNTGTAPLREMSIAINGILYGKPYKLPKKSIAFSLSEAIERDGVQRALLHYTVIKDSPSYYLNEYEMNTVGYGLLQSGKANEAASVFKLIVEAFPQLI
jgi:CubicO group peptidase (beta-lactamase class C family)